MRLDRQRSYDEPLSTFFRNVDTRSEPARNLPVGDGDGPIAALKARAVLIDMEEGVVKSALQGPLRDLFDTTQQVRSCGAAGHGGGS